MDPQRLQLPLPPPWPNAALRIYTDGGFKRAQWSDGAQAWLFDCSNAPHWIGKVGETTAEGWNIAPESADMPEPAAA